MQNKPTFHLNLLEHDMEVLHLLARGEPIKQLALKHDMSLRTLWGRSYRLRQRNGGRPLNVILLEALWQGRIKFPQEETE